MFDYDSKVLLIWLNSSFNGLNSSSGSSKILLIRLNSSFNRLNSSSKILLSG